MNALDVFEPFISAYTAAIDYAQRMLAVDRLVQAIHVSGIR